MKEYIGLSAALAGLVLVFGLATDSFLTAATFRVIANQIPAAVVLATAMTLVLVSGGIDLSVGSVLALSGAVFGISLVSWQLPIGAALAACLLTGLACGAVNGFIVVRWRVPSFIVTLGMMEAARGLAYAVTESQTRYLGVAADGITRALVAGLSPAILLAAFTVVGGHVLLTRTVFGRYLVAIGTNEEAVRLSGIDPRWPKAMVYALSGLLAAVAAVLYAARLAAADPNAATGAELQAIAAAVVGGTSLMGGRGSVVHTLFGVVLIAVLASGLAQAGAQEPTRRLITGCVIVAAAILDAYRHSRNLVNA
ncbi:MAG TPA: ABC transporter permease [Vicinamibacterales bacterium]|nr:ABC transporter permease [Vicinamibacterales bacterium]